MNEDAKRNLQAILDSPSYRLAELDTDFLQREELRPLRMELELLKPEMVLEQQGVQSTIVVFGGTQIVEPSEARRRVVAARQAMVDFTFLADEGVIADEHLDLFQFAETPQQAWDIIQAFHAQSHGAQSPAEKRLNHS